MPSNDILKINYLHVMSMEMLFICLCNKFFKVVISTATDQFYQLFLSKNEENIG